MIKALPSAQRKNHEEREAETKLADLSLSTSFGQHLLHACFYRQATDDSDQA
ncbi:hypothetical protein [Burkholderia pseudomallei]|uniref:hypothetical protein n=1 Tax=Burkholderia pseudomallei TaxID=28450 RepID=UPI0012AEC5D8|nr:hypothetical protein [Burkholderia pseudomallei]